MNKNLTFFLFIIISISGYVSLALELLVIRQLIPYLGSDIVITSIIIGTVLVSLSIGYYRIGKINIKKISIRNKILNNFTIATIFIFFGTTDIFLQYYFDIFLYFGMENKIIQTFLFSLFLLSVPSYLLAQTTPLLSNYFSKELVGKMTGRLLFYGTIGSFGGSLFTTLVIMPFFGVSYAVIFNIFLMTVVILILNKRYKVEIYIVAFLFLILAFMFNNSIYEKKIGILSNNEFSKITILNTDNNASKIMIVNNQFASKISEKNELMFEYIQYIENSFINTIPKNSKKKILILGAGGFTIGNNDEINEYIYVDIDKNLLKLSENHFLNKKLEKNKKFIVSDARIFLKNTNEKYDLIILDTYSNGIDIPTHLITEEYFFLIKNKLTKNGIMVANIITFSDFSNKFSVVLDNTLRYVFSNLQRQTIGNIDAWNSMKQNIIYTYFNDEFRTNQIYIDDKNASMYDK